MIYLSAMFSFLLGDVMMGVGRNIVFWSIAGLAASLPIPFINAGQNVILYQKVPVLHILVGNGAGSGMAVMFLCTGLLGCLFSVVSYKQKEIRNLTITPI